MFLLEPYFINLLSAQIFIYGRCQRSLGRLTVVENWYAAREKISVHNYFCLQLRKGFVCYIPSHLADDRLVANDAVSALVSVHPKLSAGHDVVKQVAHLERGKVDQLLDSVLLLYFQAFFGERGSVKIIQEI